MNNSEYGHFLRSVSFGNLLRFCLLLISLSLFLIVQKHSHLLVLHFFHNQVAKGPLSASFTKWTRNLDLEPGNPELRLTDAKKN